MYVCMYVCMLVELTLLLNMAFASTPCGPSFPGLFLLGLGFRVRVSVKG